MVSTYLGINEKKTTIAFILVVNIRFYTMIAVI